MKNLNSIFAAYLIAWGIFFAYYLTCRAPRRRASRRYQAPEKFAPSGQISGSKEARRHRDVSTWRPGFAGRC